MNILLPVLSGSEVRQFFLSGIASQLLESGHNIFTIVKYDNSQLTREIISIENRTRVLPHLQQQINGSGFAYLRTALDYWHDSVYDRWRYSPKVNLPTSRFIIYNTFKYLLGISLFNKLACRLEKKWMKGFKVDKVSKLLSDNQINKVVVSNARFLYYPELLIACMKQNIPVDVVYHSNKELHAQPRLSYDYNRFGLWNKEMQSQFIEKYPKLKSKHEVIGNSHFTYLTDGSNLLSQTDFLTKFKIPDQKSIVVLYTAAGIIVKNECLIVDWIANFLTNKKLSFKIIVRRNPMDTTDAWEDFFRNRSDVIIQHPKWVMDNELGLNYTLRSDLIEYTSLLTYMSFCINIPSTVTLEAAIAKKPVINICFDFPGVEVSTNEGRIKEFWDAPFYKVYHKQDFVLPAFDMNQLSGNLVKLTSKLYTFKDYQQCVWSVLDENETGTNSRIINFITSTN